MERYFVVYKPYMMLSQFVSPYPHRLLGDLDFQFPNGTHALGRLDEPSEGLLLLTTDKTMHRRLLLAERAHSRRYLVQVDKVISAADIQRLQEGITIGVKGKGDYTTLPCRVTRVEKPAWLPERENNVYEKLPHSWLEFELTEGKNRQIRKMCSAVKHKCRRLVRVAIGDLVLGQLQPGEVLEMERSQLFALLGLDPQGPYRSGRKIV